MKIVVDTNVILDALLARKPFVRAAAQLFARIADGKYIAHLCATTITTTHYVAAKAVGNSKAHDIVKQLLGIFEIAPVNRYVIENAIKLNFTDFEDAVLYAAAQIVDAQAIITRDKNGFKKATIPIYSSEEFISAFAIH